MEILGRYKDGARVVREGPFHSQHLIAFENCPDCEGKGYTKKYEVESKSVWHTRETKYIQCIRCIEKHPTKNYLKKTLDQIIKDVKSIVYADRRQGISTITKEYIEGFIDHPLNKKYRKYLCMWWAFKPEEMIKENNNA